MLDYSGIRIWSVPGDVREAGICLCPSKKSPFNSQVEANYCFDIRKRWEYSLHCCTNKEMVAHRSYRTCPKLNYSDTVELVFDWVTLSTKPSFFAYEHVDL